MDGHDGFEEYEAVEVTAVVWAAPPATAAGESVPKLQPLRFVRCVHRTSGGGPGFQQEHRIERIVSVWKSYDGVYPFHHYGVEDSDGTLFHLIFDARKFTWWAQAVV